MIEILLDGNDFSERLLDPNGVSVLRESIDKSDFVPVGSTARVSLSDIDFAVSDALGIHRELSDPIITPIDFPVSVAGDGGSIISGFISPGTLGVSRVNWNNLDSERVIEFEVMDDFLYAFSYWQKRHIAPLLAPYSIPGGQQVISGGAAFYVVELTAWLQLITGAPWVQEVWAAPIYLEVDLGPDGFGNYSTYGLSRMVGSGLITKTRKVGVRRSGGEVETKPRSYFVADFLLDIAAWFVADIYLIGGVFYLRRRGEYRPGPSVVISEFSEISALPEPGLNVEEVEDRHWVYIRNPSGEIIGAEPRLWYYYLSGGSLLTRDQSESEKSALISPGFTDEFTMHEMKFFHMAVANGIWLPVDWSHSDYKRVSIADMLAQRYYSRVVTTGMNYYPGQRAIIGGGEYRIESADLKPMSDDADLIVSQQAG